MWRNLTNMKNTISYILILFITGYSAFGQMPFEKHKAIKVKEYKKWISIDKIDKEGKLISYITIPAFFKSNQSITIQFICNNALDYSIIKIFKNKSLIQTIREPDPFYGLQTPYPVFLADYNNDSLIDIKFLVPNFACGAFNTYSRVIYLLQKKNGKFNKISFTDHFNEEATNRLEMDFDNDGKFEIITETFQNYKKHNYWVYNLYDFHNYELTNVNQKEDYPIMIQLLYSGNSNITKNLTREKMKSFTRKLPDDYNSK